MTCEILNVNKKIVYFSFLRFTDTFFKQLSLGTDIIWALNSNDEVYAVVCNPGLINSDSELDWTLIENSANFNITFIDVSCANYAIASKVILPII